MEKKYKYCKNQENFDAYKVARNQAVTEKKTNYRYEKDGYENQDRQ